MIVAYRVLRGSYMYLHVIDVVPTLPEVGSEVPTAEARYQNIPGYLYHLPRQVLVYYIVPCS